MAQTNKSIRFERSLKSGNFEIIDPEGIIPAQDRPRVQQLLRSRHEELHERDGQRIEINTASNGKPHSYQFLVRSLGGHRPNFELTIEGGPETLPEDSSPPWSPAPLLDRFDRLVEPLRKAGKSSEERAGLTCLDFALGELRRAAGDDPDRFALALLTGFTLLEYHRAALGPSARRDVYMAAIGAVDRLFEGETARIDHATAASAHAGIRSHLGWAAVVLSHVLGNDRRD